MSEQKFVMPPDGTSSGYRTRDGAMWVGCEPGPDKKPGIAYCVFPGNWVNPVGYELVAVFEKAADRDLVLSMHKELVAPTQPDELTAAQQRVAELEREAEAMRAVLSKWESFPAYFTGAGELREETRKVLYQCHR